MYFFIQYQLLQEINIFLLIPHYILEIFKNSSNLPKKMEEISKNNFEEKVHNNKKTVVVDFYSNTCPPCKQLAPVFESIAEKLKNKADFFKIKLEENQEIFSEYTIRSVPTVIILKQSAPIAESLGFKDEETLTSWIEEHL